MTEPSDPQPPSSSLSTAPAPSSSPSLPASEAPPTASAPLPADQRAGPSPVRLMAGLAMVGYGLLVAAGVIAHEARVAGLLSLAVGALLLARGLPALPAARSRLVLGIGAALVLGVVGYNLARASGLSPPEWGLLAYGLALCAASRFLHRRVGRTNVASLVGWSFPLLLVPLLLFGLNAVASSGSSETAASPLVQLLIVQPTAAALRLIGTPTRLVGSTMMVATPRGTLALSVGLVCAGLYPMVLFGGIVSLHAWRERLGARRTATLLAAGLASLWALNVVRLVILTRIGIAWGPVALQDWHANLGWVLFALFMVVFWGIALRRTTPRPPRTAS